MVDKCKQIEFLDLAEFCQLSEEKQREKMLELIKEYRNRKPVEPEIVDCDICCGSFKSTEFLTLKCGHSFCPDCFKDMFITHVNSSQNPFPCPQAGCKYVLDAEEIYLYNLHDGDDKVLNNYIRQLTVALLDNCRKECPGCNDIIQFKAGSKHVECPCGKKFCGECGLDIHDGKTCLEYVKLLKAMKTKMIWSETVKPCPGCEVPILKDGGCQWMNCRQCRAYFCWVCLQVTDDHRHRPGQVCKAHRDLNADN